MAYVDNTPDQRYHGIYEGVITDNEDPRKVGRVRARIPGLLEPDGPWMLPMGMPGSGSPQRGFWDVPDVGAEVYVCFLGGDPDKPRFWTGHWGLPGGVSEVPTQPRDAMEQDGTEAAWKIKAYETKDWVLVFDEREDSNRLFLKRKRDTGNDEDLTGNALMLELDAVQGTLAISAPAGISLKSLGIIDIDGLVVNIGGRKVIKGIGENI